MSKISLNKYCKAKRNKETFTQFIPTLTSLTNFIDKSNQVSFNLKLNIYLISKCKQKLIKGGTLFSRHTKRALEQLSLNLIPYFRRDFKL